MKKESSDGDVPSIEKLTDDQIKHWGKQWKDALGMNPYRAYCDQDFMAGATAVRDYVLSIPTKDNSEGLVSEGENKK